MFMDVEAAEKTMARWPDDRRTIMFGMLLIFALLPLLCWLAWWFVQG
jgi:predicted MFS family arabinose efflux permease